MAKEVLLFMLKVYFAAVEDINYAIQAKLGGAKYCLMTAYPFVKKNVSEKSPVVEYLSTFSKNIILDSGLFTLMFGAEKGVKSKEFIYDWYERLIRYIRAQEGLVIPVEVDCQKILSPEDAWELRIKMKQDLPNQKIINVFHMEDGRTGLDRLIEFSDYIAISVPELRANKKIDHKAKTVELAHYIKNKKPSIDIHLLGCTELELLRRCNFCTSCDSTSWKQFARWGEGSFVTPTGHIKGRYRTDVKNTLSLVDEELRSMNKQTTDNLRNIIANGIIQVQQHIKIYSLYAGSQD